MKKQKINIITLGCSKNVVDSEHLMAQLHDSGFELTFDSNSTDARTVVINTCGFIGDAKEESINTILSFADAKTKGAIDHLFVMGCLSERYKKELQQEIPEADEFFGVNNLSDVIRAVGGAYRDELVGERYLTTPSHYAYLKISEGCNWGCGYCAIPLIRGNLRSRTIDDVVKEAEFLAGQGVKELILVAQDLTAFGQDRGEVEIAPLLEALNAVEGIEWIRLLYAYPERITDEFIDAMVRNKKVLHYLDIPIQHIDSDVLRAMNRKGDEQTVRTALARLRKAMPDITLRTTLIAGFPGETEEQFEKLCAFVREERFDRLGCFAYSEEEGTPAARMEQMPMEMREERAAAVMRAQADVMNELQAAKVGSVMQVICDGYDDENDLYLCRSRGDAPEIDSEVCVASETPLYPGNFYTVCIKDSDVYDLYAELTEEAEQ